jgi:predicted GNAT family acetyltransferase
MEIEHDQQHSRFMSRLPEGTAVLRYDLRNPGIMDIQSTFVPPAARGRGVGGDLVQAALSYAERAGCRVIPSCWYVRTWVSTHPDYAALLQE